MTIFNDLVDNCEGYACGPTHSTPSSEIIVKTVHDTLAVTGGNTDAALWWVGGFLVVASVILFTLNEMKKRDRNDDE